MSSFFHVQHHATYKHQYFDFLLSTFDALSFSSKIALATTSNSYPVTGKSAPLCLVQAIQHNNGCWFVLYSLYNVEVCSFYT